MPDAGTIKTIAIPQRLDAHIRASDGKLVVIRIFFKKKNHINSADYAGGGRSAYGAVAKEYEQDPKVVFLEMGLTYSNNVANLPPDLKVEDIPLFMFVKGGSIPYTFKEHQLKDDNIG
ncbi:unnamed protein product [Rhizoctonia solani]|uniref:Uncharacterized protein n=1 Tax=Rhizoctonia solani TaxID=456999 RepID=A0A8H3G8K3_9AGAM|nr:unnamed protein product [Rhizoctonia solani]